jgi:HSP20 family protein
MVAIIRRNPGRALRVIERPWGLLEDMDKMISGLWESWEPMATTLTPKTDIIEEKDGLMVKAELPGIKKSELDIALEGDMLTIKAEKQEEKVEDDATYYRCERSFGQYMRHISLPYQVDAEQISATFKDGLLKIKLPRGEEAKSKRIEIKSR